MKFYNLIPLLIKTNTQLIMGNDTRNHISTQENTIRQIEKIILTSLFIFTLNLSYAQAEKNSTFKSKVSYPWEAGIFLV